MVVTFREAEGPKVTARPGWNKDELKTKGSASVRKLPHVCPVPRTGADCTQLSGTNRVAERTTDARPAAYMTINKFVAMGPLTHAPLVIRSDLSDPSTSWADRLPHKPYNGMPLPSSPKVLKRFKDDKNLTIDTKNLSTKEISQQWRLPPGSEYLGQKLPPQILRTGFIVSSRECASEPTSPQGIRAAASKTHIGMGGNWVATRLHGELATFGNQWECQNRDFMPKPDAGDEACGNRIISRLCERTDGGALYPVETVGAKNIHSYTGNPSPSNLTRQYTVPATSADEELLHYDLETRFQRNWNRDSRTHRAHWGGTTSSPSLRLWAPGSDGTCDSLPCSPMSSLSPKCLLSPQWTAATKWCSQQME